MLRLGLLPPVDYTHLPLDADPLRQRPVLVLGPALGRLAHA